jgi:glycosyltransferase involved in cell wall biosynthesis
MSRAPAVLHVSSMRGWGGGENQVRLLMRELARTQVRQLCVCPADSPLAARLANLGLPVQPIAWRTSSDPRALFAIARLLKGFDIVHCHDANALQMTLLPAMLRGTRIVASRRTRFKTNALKWNRADRVIAVSETVRARLLDDGIKPDRIVVIHSGTDLAETRAVKTLEPTLRQKLRLPAGAFVAGSAAAFVAPKNLPLIAEAAAMLPAVHWLLAGDGPERARVQAAIATHEVTDRVHLLGWLPEARAMLRELDLYVSTSVDDGLGNSITESFALRVPVVAADAGGPAEILRPIQAQTGAVLFEPRDAAALAAVVERMRTDAALRAQVVAAQDARFGDFAVERTAAATVELYYELLNA